MDKCSVIEWAIDAGAPSAAASRVLITLARLSEDGVCSASQIEIARRSFLSERQTRTILKQLEAHEYALISRERRGGSGHGRHYDVYRLALPEQPEKAQPANIAAAFVEERATGNSLQNAPEKPEQPAIFVDFVKATGNPCAQPANIAAASEATGNPPHTPQLPSSRSEILTSDVVTPLSPPEPSFALSSEPIAKPKRSDRRGTRIAPDWQPSFEDRNFARRHGLTESRIDRLAAQFVDYWTAAPGKNAAKLDWSATWRNRVRDVTDRKTDSQNPVTIVENGNVTRFDPNERAAQWRPEGPTGNSGHGQKSRGRFEICRDVATSGGTF